MSNRSSLWGSRPPLGRRHAIGIVAIAVVLGLGSALIGLAGGVGSSATALAPPLRTDSSPVTSFSPADGGVGSDLAITGSGFTVGDAVTPYFNGSAEACLSPTDVASDGTFDCTVLVPFAAAGNYSIGASTADDGLVNASTNFTVTPTLTFSPASGPGESDTTLTGTGFTSGQAVQALFNSADVACNEGAVTVDGSGNFSCEITVPSSPSADYPVAATTTADGTVVASTDFEITPTLVLAPTSGVVGSTTDASGTGFSASTSVTFTLAGNAASSSSCVTDSAGNFSACAVTIPAAPYGVQDLVATAGSVDQSAAFNVGTSLALAPAAGVVGSTTTASGSGFPASQTVAFTLDGVSAPSSSCTAFANGSFGCAVTIPAVPHGAEPLIAASGAASATATFTVGTSLTLAPTSGVVGSSTTATGTGFAPSQAIAFELDGSSASGHGCSSSSSGTFSCSVTIPEVPGGAESLSAYDGTNYGYATFTVAANVTVSPTSGAVGSSVTVAGTGFPASASLTAKWNAGTTICTTTSGADGGFECTPAAVPASSSGPNVVGVYQGGNFLASATFTVTTSFSLSQSDGPVDTTVTLQGTGFSSGTVYDYCLLATQSACSGSPSTFTALANGSVPSAVTLTIPDSSAPGAYYVDVSYDGAYVISAPFTVTTQSLDLSPTSGPVGGVIALTGSGYVPSTSYQYCFVVGIESCLANATSFTSTAAGEIPSGTTLTVPPTTSGGHDVDVYLSSTLLLFEPFTVTASLELNPASGPVGTTVTAQAEGLDADAVYVLAWSGSPLGCANTTSSIGTASCTFSVPSTPGGGYSVELAEGTNTPSATFTVTASLSASPTYGNVGQSVQWMGAGFPASTAASVEWNATTTLCTTSTDAAGVLQCSGTIPSTHDGTYSVAGVVGATTASTDWTVEPQLSVTPIAGIVGSSVTAVGTGFDAVTAFTLDWNSSTVLCTGGSTDSAGQFSCSFAVPIAVSGVETLSATEGTNTATAAFTVEASISISDTVGFVGTPETVTGAGFDPDAPFSLTWDTSTVLCGALTNGLGEFGCTFAIPASTAGTHVVTADEGENTASVDYQVVPSLTLSVSTGAPGTLINATGGGFGSGAAFVITWNGSGDLCSGTTSASGSLSCAFRLPDVSGGAGSIVAVQGSNVASAAFVVSALVALSVASGTVGTSVDVLGAGFDASGSVTIVWNSTTTVCIVGTTPNGTFACAFLVPLSPGGAHTLTTFEGSISVPSSFTVEAEVSLAPTSAGVGATVEVNGTGFGASVGYAVVWNNTQTLCSGLTDTNGAFACSFQVPTSGAGPIVISTRSGTTLSTSSFTVTSSPPPPPSSSPSTFPWWIVVAIGLAAALVLALLLAYEHRRHHRPRASSPGRTTAPVQPWTGSAASLAPVTDRAAAAESAAVAVPGPTAPPTASATAAAGAPGEEDIDLLIARLERMSQQMFKKSPRELSQEEPAADEGAPPSK